MKILVTGADGFTGKHFAEEAKSRAHEVIALKANLNNLASLKQEISSIKPDAVVHLAAISFVVHGNADEIYQTNIVGTRNLLEALANSTCIPHCILLASSANIYGNTLVSPINELVLPMPANDYAVSKLAMEHMAQLWADQLPITIVRPFNYTGVGQSINFIIPKIVNHYQHGAGVIELGNLDVARDFSDVRMVVKAYCQLIESNLAGEIFNVCSGKPYTLTEILAMVAKICGYEINVHINPAFVRNNEVKTLCGSNKKLIKAVGSLDMIPLEHTLQWMFENGKKIKFY